MINMLNLTDAVCSKASLVLQHIRVLGVFCDVWLGHREGALLVIWL